ncbi:ABC transporter permease [Allomuricauda sp. SCSIO 65647]|uniref:ABC transporter permease n=1 Tax=Allomuricauda sp. SCSIO 65647 TaxID=2908843 RepID=UPI001F3F084E|nr:ABC transporter permease [Muricauda sp. SCSIO 65647]UJH69165.1 ABC transporter permease [Muricauda sp. SCSIO 65647]
MFKNYLKIAWRNLLRNKGFSALNILGLSIGLTVTALIVLWINFEIGFDKFHDNDARIYQVYNQYPVDGEIWTWNSTPKIMAKTIKNMYPEVERVTRHNYENLFLFTNGEKNIKGNGTFVDPDFLHIFSFPLVKGDINQVLDGVNSVVVTETFAKKLFGDNDPMGKTVKIDNEDLFTVTGVLKDLPKNTEFTFEYLIPWKYLTQKGLDDENWGNNSVATYVMLKNGVDHGSFASKIKTLRKVHDKDSPEMVTYLYPFSRNHLYGEFENGLEKGGQIDIIRMFGIIAGIVLLIACINFMNLSTARSEKRAKEVGVRKVVGARKSSLIGQFMGESILLAIISAFFALILVVITLPTFSGLVEKPLSLNFRDPMFWVISGAIVIFTGLLAGSYPSLYLSAFKPASVLKGTFQKQNTLITPRKILVVTQFAVAIILISSTLIVRQQLNKVQNRQMGYSQDKLVYVEMEGDLQKNYALIKKELNASGTTVAVTKTMSPITQNWSNSWNIGWKGKDPEDKTLILRFNADDDVIKTFGFELVEGRDFDKTRFPTDSTAMIINEAAVAHMGFDEPIGKQISDMGTDWTVIGVVKDFILTSPFQKIEPMIVHCGWADNIINMKLNPNRSIGENLAQAETIFKKFNPNYPFEYKFVDKEYERKFNNQKRTETLASWSTLLTIIISCLGLFGLASYMAENRIKEIGVRKVLGASVGNITTLLSKSFLKLVALACLIAIPVSWIFMREWLQNFDFRIEPSGWTFLFAGVLAIAIALITVSYQAIKAAIRNPVKSLRTE